MFARSLSVDDETLVRAMYPRLRAFASAVAPISVDPDDLVQDALVRVLTRRRLCSLDHPEAYLRTTLLNLASNRRRGLARMSAAIRRLTERSESIDHYPSDLAALLDLAPETRAVLWLADVEGLSFDEIAKELGLSAAAARKRASRGRAQIRTSLEAGAVEAPPA